MSFAVRTAKGRIKIHTCWDDAKIANITPAKVHHRQGVQLIFPKETIIVEDREYVCNSVAEGVKRIRGTPQQKIGMYHECCGIQINCQQNNLSFIKIGQKFKVRSRKLEQVLQTSDFRLHTLSLIRKIILNLSTHINNSRTKNSISNRLIFLKKHTFKPIQ